LRGSGVLHVVGFGHGHGVGFCQWGARSAAARGMSASDIVQFYFPGTDLGRA
jgi:stage II sporulation protein D